MKKIAFIKISNTPVPIEAGNDYIILDCRQTNDFCSFVGDALVGDLKDEQGTPIYRLLKSMGYLLSDFEIIEKESYNLILSQWWNILSEILHKGLEQYDKQIAIIFPQLYTDWLINNENDYYVELGKNLQANHGRVNLDAYGISGDIISALRMKINRFLNEQKDEIEYVVFSNKRIGNSSNIIKQLRNLFDNYSFLRYEQWEHILIEEKQRKIENLEDYRAFWLEDLKLGVTTEEDIPQSRKDNYKGFHLEFKKEGKLSRIKTCDFHADDAYNSILSVIYGKKQNRHDLSYNKVAKYLLCQKGFYVSIPPHKKWHELLKRYCYEGDLRKDTDTFSCLVHFFSTKEYKEIADFEEEMDSLTAIDIKLK